MKNPYLLVLALAICNLFTNVNAQFDISPNSKTVTWPAGTTTYAVSSTVGWGVSDNASWLTATKTNGSTISVSYSQNNSTNYRTASITANGTGGVTETVTLRQAPAGVNFNSDTENIGSASGTKNLYVSANFDWTVSDDASWFTAVKTNGNTITLNYNANPSTSSRTGHITVAGTGGLLVTGTITIIQAGAPPSLNISPNSLTVQPESGSGTFSVASNVGWSVSDDASWLTATKTNGSTITFSYSANTATTERTAHITATGTGGLTETVTVYQEDAYISFNGPPNSVSSSAGSQYLQVRIKFSEWSVSDDASWVTVTRTPGSDWIDVSWEANPSTSSRTARVTVSGTGEITNTGTFSFTQAGAPPKLEISPTSLWVDPESGSTTFSVTSNVGWSVSDDKTWVTATKTDASTITVSYEVNTLHVQRQAHITVVGTGGITETVTLYQEDAYIGFISPPENVSADVGSQNVHVNTRISEWDVSADASWVTLNTVAKTVVLSWEANPSTNPRQANITIAGTGEITNSNSFTLSQAGAPASIDVSPNSKEAGPGSGTSEFNVSSNVGWSVSDDASWLTATKTDGSTISVVYDSFSSTQNRTANITVTGTGGLSETVTFTQIGAPYLEIDPNTYEVGPNPNMLPISFSTNVDWTVSVDVSWLSAHKDTEASLLVFFAENPTSNPRTAIVTVTGTGGLSETITITQAGLEPTLSLPYPEVYGSAGGGMFSTYIESSILLWTVSSEATWLTATRVNNDRIDVYYEANPSTMPRRAIITVDATGGVTGSFILTQPGAEAYLDVSPNNISAAADLNFVRVDVTANVDWTVSDDASWLSATNIGGYAIYFDLELNLATSPRTANITLNGGGDLTETLTVTQEGAEVYINFDPESFSVDAASGSVSFGITSNADWSVFDNATWLTVEKTGTNTINASYEANTSDSPRIGQITVEGPGGVTETTTITQSSETITMDVSPKNTNVGPASGTSTFDVNSNIEWTVSTEVTWLTLTKTDGSTITSSYEANTSISLRSAQITVEGTGGITEIVSLTQEGETATLGVSPDNESVDATSGTSNLNVYSNVDWIVSVDVAWLTATKSDGSTISLSYEANNSTDSRLANITVSGGGISETVVFTQAGVIAFLEVNPQDKSVDAASGTLSITVEANVEWTVSDDASWLTITGIDETSISVSFEANTQELPRTANIFFEGSGGVSQTVTISQASETITFYVTPKNQDVDAASGTVSFDISSNIEWGVSYDAEWLTALKTDDSTISVSYDSNPELNPRTAYILVVGAGDITEIIAISQAGEALYLGLDPLHKMVGSASDSIAIPVTSNTNWSASEEAGWLSIEKSGDTLLMVYFEENTSNEVRSAEITFYGEGLNSQKFTLEQEGAGLTGIADPEGPVHFTVYPNPAKHNLHIRPGKDIDSEILISLFDGAGKMLYTSSAERISASEIKTIDISGYYPGLYLIRIHHSGLIITKKVVIR